MDGLTETKIRYMLRNRESNGLDAAEVVYKRGNTTYLHPARFERWLAGKA